VEKEKGNHIDFELKISMGQPEDVTWHKVRKVEEDRCSQEWIELLK
jgi:hypothetical protein